MSPDVRLGEVGGQMPDRIAYQGSWWSTIILVTLQLLSVFDNPDIWQLT